jgi:glycosyltransferase involved in cell wall biosynthesis
MSKFALKIAAKLHKNPEISLIICTHNRAELLNESLNYYHSLEIKGSFEIIVVLNACTDHSLEIVKKYSTTLANLRYVVEDKLGHSNARNAGWKNAHAPFVFYIDDDAYPESDLVKNLLSLLVNNNISCVSGHTKYWKSNSPSWIKPDLVEIPLLLESFGELPKSGYINGCACGFQKEVLEELGGFNPKVGMKGSKLGYYDEIYIQDILRKQNRTIHYAPELIVNHQSHQKSPLDFLKSAFAKGRSKKKVREIGFFKTTLKFCYATIIAIINLPLSIMRHGFNYAIVSQLKEPVRILGQL